MRTPIPIRFGGYSPKHTTHSRAASKFKEALIARMGKAVQVEIVWNVLDLGYKGGSLSEMVEDGTFTMCYSSTCYGLSNQIPALKIIDLPYTFENEEHAHNVLDGELGAFLTREIESCTEMRVLGYWDNGFRHVSNCLRPIRHPKDCAGLRIRLMPNDIHKKTFELLGAHPISTDLEQARAMMASGELDAQENPLANTVNYGIDKFHNHFTMSGHFYATRGIFVHRVSFDAWPNEVQIAVRESAREAVIFQRKEAQAEELTKRGELEKEGALFVDLSADERGAFVKAVSPVVEEARTLLGDELFRLAALK